MSEAIYEILIAHSRPKFRESVTFIKVYRVQTKENEDYLKKIFTKAFREAHPTWMIKKVKVEKEK